MSNRDRVDKLIGELGAEVGIEGMHLDEKDACALMFDQTIIVNIAYREEDDDIVLFCQLGFASDANKLALFQHLLESNFFWVETRGSTLALEKDSGTIVLLNRLPAADTEFPKLLSLVEAFVNSSESWMQNLREFEPERDAAPPPAEIAPLGVRV